ncbi:hypothetical protein PIROE2DRAFT_12362 [Piromyces sp. E2]|nr:hypothetical protein PIROE2DRAFT_12362 [Piromyces sp. E2]|eukprot:OUM61582.1 hypothetical protein PIROE2DRAFT_12362 [Piromyces sp. E2]
MFINNIILSLYLIFYIHVVNGKLILSKDEVLDISDEYFISFYCKNNTCVSASYEYDEKTVVIPDENGNMIQYITQTCTLDNIEYNICSSEERCTTDSQCLSNKCFRNYCVFNDATPIVHCDDIYSSPFYFKERSSYMYCGKAYGDTCETDDECSSKNCYKGTCLKQELGPRESEDLQAVILLMIYVAIIIFIIIVCWCYWRYRNELLILDQVLIDNKPVSLNLVGVVTGNLYPIGMIHPNKCDINISYT